MADDFAPRIPDDFPDAELVRARLDLDRANKALRYMPALDDKRSTTYDRVECLRRERIMIHVEARTPYGVHAKLDVLRDLLEIGSGGNEAAILDSAIRDLQALELEWDASNWDKTKNRRRPVN